MKTRYFLSFILALSSLNVFSGDKKEPLKTININENLSTIVEFNQEPEALVIGNKKAFHVEKLQKRLVINSTLKAPQNSNLFVLFKGEKMAFLYLISNPGLSHNDFVKIDYPKVTLAKKPIKIKKKRIKKKRKRSTWGKIHIKAYRAVFSHKKDYLEIRLKISNGLKHRITPALSFTTIKSGKKYITPDKVFSERKTIASGSYTYVKLIFLRPDLPGKEKRFQINIPIKETKKTLKSHFYPIMRRK